MTKLYADGERFCEIPDDPLCRIETVPYIHHADCSSYAWASTNCPNCGAPLARGKVNCEYCGTGRPMKNEVIISQDSIRLVCH